MEPKLAVCVALISFPLWGTGAWEAIGPFGGSAAVVRVDRQHRGTVLAASSNSQLFRSDDSGASWRSLTFPPELRATLHAFIVDPHASGVFLVGLSSNILEYSGLFRSEDGGLTWERFASPGLQDVWSIAIWDRDPRVIAAGTVEGVFLTRDGGKSWQHLGSVGDPEPKPVVSLAFDPLDSNILYAGTPHLPWKTVDGGVTWHSVHVGMLDDSDVFSILIDNLHRRTLFAGACSGIFRSVDGGATWTKLQKAKVASERTFQIVQHPLRPGVLLAATALGLIRSLDGGATWQRLSTHSTRSIAFDSVQPDRIFLATDAGLYRSDNLGETLQPADRGFSNRRFHSLTVSGSTLYVGLHDSRGPSILRRQDADNWEVLPPGQVAEGNPLDTEDNVYPPDDAGLTWNLVNFQNRSPDHVQIYGVIAIDEHDLLAATSEGLMRSRDKGGTWRPLAGVLGANTVSAICRHPTKTGILFASQFGTVFASLDHGRSWAPMREGTVRGTVLALRVIPGYPDRLFALTEQCGIYTIPLASLE